MSSRIRLLSFLTHSPINHTLLSWTDERDQRLAGLRSFDYWQDLARTLERGCFDGAFFADTLGGFEHYKERVDEAVKYAVWWPPHDPMPVIATMAAATKHLGMAVTLSLSGTHPYLAVRTLSTLDCLSNGRIGWNIVTGSLRGEHRALGLDQMEHDERYERAEEYLDICYKLWDGVSDDAILIDRENGIFADPSRVDRVRVDGRYLKIDAVPPTLPSPQRRPVLFQAGSSGRGQRFAAKHADAIFAIQPSAESMRKLVDKFADGAKQAGRPGGSRVTFGLHVVLGGTEEEAKREYAHIVDRIPIEGALSRLSGSLGVDFSKFELDKPLEEMETQSSRGLMVSAMTSMAGSGRATLREAAVRWAAAAGCMPVVGTPEQVADKIESLWRETGAFGFNITPSVTPLAVADFVDHVVPILQRRGLVRKEYTGATFRDNLLND